MDVLSLFDGISCGQVALNRAGIEFDTYYAAEIDKFAIQVTNHNFPDTIQLGDVTRWREWNIDWTNIGLVTGGFPCFTAGTLITTNRGLVEIEKIKAGDLVLTHEHRFKPVVIPMIKVADHVNQIKIQGSHLIEATDEHPFYVRRMTRKWDSTKKQDIRTFSEPSWVNASDLSKGDFIGIARNMNSITPEFNSTPPFWKMVGRYLADGYSSTEDLQGSARPRRVYKTIITCGHHEIGELNNIVMDAGYTATISREPTSYKLHITNKELWEFIQDFGRGAANKKLPGYVFDMPTDLLESLIEGYLSGDGSVVTMNQGTRSNIGQYSITSVSKYLIYGFQQLIQKVYKTQPTVTRMERSPTCVIEGRVVNQLPTYQMRFYKEKRPQSNFFEEGGFIWAPFKGSKRVEGEFKVFNFEVEEDNSYAVNNLIVHNCQAWSMAGRQLGDKDPRGMLFWTMLEIIQHVKAHNSEVKFLIENVKMKTEFEEYITHHTTEALGTVYKTLINSALVSAQNRNRYYWTSSPVDELKDKSITWGDVRERGVNKFYYTEAGLQWIGRSSNKRGVPLRIWADDEKAQMVEASHFKGYSNQRFFGICDYPSDEECVAAMRGRYLNAEGKRDDRGQSEKGNTAQFVEFRYDGKTNALTTVNKDNIVVPFTLPGRIPVNEFFFRYITPLECERLQTLDDNYTACVSNTQRYKACGNGWTVDVIVHILNSLFKEEK